MPSIAATEAQLRADDRPVLFLDTCILLDIIRATYRCLGAGYVQRAADLGGLLTSRAAAMRAGRGFDGAAGVGRQRDEGQR
jgi:hypothetical protein